MLEIGIRELRSDLASAVRRAGAGERVIVTIGGAPVAQLGPIEAPDAATTIDDLAARGLLVRSRRDDRPEPEFVMPMWAGARLDQLVREVRSR